MSMPTALALDWLTPLYPDVQRTVDDALADSWSELQAACGAVLEEPPPVHSVAILPLLCCRAIGGEPRAAVPVAASLVLAAMSVRIVDDLVDKDRPGQLWTEVGDGRAWNYAAALFALSLRVLSQAGWPAPVFRKMNRLFLDTYLRIGHGQDCDALNTASDMAAHMQTVELKTASAYSAACAAGALVETDDQRLVDACSEFGRHAGLAIQIFNDLESIWRPDGISDPQRGKLSVALIYGLERNHEWRDELQELVRSGQTSTRHERVREILDAIDTRGFMLWAALQEREAALVALRDLPDAKGREALAWYITGMFGDIESLRQD